jgi:hypothetical protein
MRSKRTSAVLVSSRPVALEFQGKTPSERDMYPPLKRFSHQVFWSFFFLERKSEELE